MMAIKPGSLRRLTISVLPQFGIAKITPDVIPALEKQEDITARAKEIAKSL